MRTESFDTTRPIEELLVATRALLGGHFRLSSGLHSDRYIQCALLLQYPSVAERVGHDLAARLHEARLEVDVIVGPALGGVLVAHELARALGVRALYTERDGARMALRRGFALTAGERVLIVEDVITTGLSAREAAAVCQQAGGVVAGYAAIVERAADHGLAPCLSLWQFRPRTFAATDCPLCAAGSVPQKPGSRTAEPSARQGV